MAPTRQLDLPSITALVIEVDGPDFIEACALLEDEGLRVREGHDEGDALEILDRQRIDFAMLAVKLLYGKDNLKIASMLDERGIPFFWTYRTEAERRMIPASLRDRPTLRKPLSIEAAHDAVALALAGRAVFDQAASAWTRLT